MIAFLTHAIGEILIALLVAFAATILALPLLAVSSRREVTADARDHRQILAAVRRSGWLRCSIAAMWGSAMLLLFVGIGCALIVQQAGQIAGTKLNSAALNLFLLAMPVEIQGGRA